MTSIFVVIVNQISSTAVAQEGTELSCSSPTLLFYKLGLPGVPAYVTDVLEIETNIKISAIPGRIKQQDSFLAQNGSHYAYIIYSGINNDDVLKEWEIWDIQSHGGSQNNPLLIKACIPTVTESSKYIVSL
jgi:hypothetical protein